MSHLSYTTTPSNNPSFFWSHALDQSATAPMGDGCTALLDGSGIGHDFGHHIGNGHTSHGNGNGYGHNDGNCVPAAGAVALFVVALAVVAKRAR